ncbi:phage head protein [Elizabethkingia meningoseptica]|uniref:HK97 family phage prohead protease n=1 Tax=Elizabethkingia meningoseptica TaxID=238 RepID=UPI0008419942|nr:HK97 family phage prohead protease [Elizabethkingia meningoseptica]ODM52212.1 phage head protein [Elizabethkingia meningoseptica]OHT26986.1 phage head protein [Elizabethkingia meningoseptica]OPC10850.1 phage head protein [Elizabethkingia meningoseptica]
MNKAPLFITNDQQVRNSYGFYVDTAGIDLKSRFDTNPVCLNNHSNDTKDVLGKWIDIEVKDGKLLMRPAFDTKDPAGEEVVRKVLSGTLKGCSLGIMFDPADLVNEGGKLILKKCVLFEVSIVAVPSNGNAIALFNMNEERLSEADIKSLCLSLQTVNPFENNKTMKILLAHLQLPEGSTEEAILTAIKATESQLTASKTQFTELKTKYDALEAKQNAKLQADYEGLKTAALKDGRIDAAAVPTIEELPLEKRIDLLNTLPKRGTVKEAIENQDGKSPTEKYEKLSWEQLDKGDHLATLKSKHPEYYEQRFEQQYGRKPNKK